MLSRCPEGAKVRENIYVGQSQAIRAAAPPSISEQAAHHCSTRVGTNFLGCSAPVLLQCHRDGWGHQPRSSLIGSGSDIIVGVERCRSGGWVHMHQADVPQTLLPVSAHWDWLQHVALCNEHKLFSPCRKGLARIWLWCVATAPAPAPSLQIPSVAASLPAVSWEASLCFCHNRMPIGYKTSMQSCKTVQLKLDVVSSNVSVIRQLSD